MSATLYRLAAIGLASVLIAPASAALPAWRCMAAVRPVRPPHPGLSESK